MDQFPPWDRRRVEPLPPMRFKPQGQGAPLAPHASSPEDSDSDSDGDTASTSSSRRHGPGHYRRDTQPVIRAAHIIDEARKAGYNADLVACISQTAAESIKGKKMPFYYKLKTFVAEATLILREMLLLLHGASRMPKKIHEKMMASAKVLQKMVRKQDSKEATEERKQQMKRGL